MTQLQYWKGKAGRALAHGGMKQHMTSLTAAPFLMPRRPRCFAVVRARENTDAYDCGLEGRVLRRESARGESDRRRDQMELLSTLSPSPSLMRRRNYPVKFKGQAAKYSRSRSDGRSPFYLPLRHLFFSLLLRILYYFYLICQLWRKNIIRSAYILALFNWYRIEDVVFDFVVKLKIFIYNKNYIYI